ncbi:hypothetical protein EIP91_002336 [Steccherinum ochraceum]|uniref:NADH:flavin oxidoreductase/NADH oxidase N-terminal domain-containing protein n=1 Tax=Steccherinum ochraceum TaxID=92696 RepID=A0A4R0RG08_9APHY|nr:hypothetical protein EIP91_002336 [Steccherinum ochraceum]
MTLHAPFLGYKNNINLNSDIKRFDLASMVTTTSIDLHATRIAPAAEVTFFVPAQHVPAGTAVDPQSNGKPIPDLFKPLTIRGVTFQNRVWVSPMGQYSAKDGFPSPWHKAFYCGLLIHGPGLTSVEATAVSARGRVTPEDCGIWSDAHVAAWKEITAFAHSQNQKIGIQLAHGGRKSSISARWLIKGGLSVPAEHGGWPEDVYAPSAVQFAEGMATPKEMTKDHICEVVKEFKDAARRAVDAGFDTIELHGAHGLLMNSFDSPTSNHRTDEYGGSWENRTRFTLEVIQAVRSVIPDTMPLFYRISATEYLESQPEASWQLEDTVKFAGIIANHGVDLIDLSAGGNSMKQDVKLGPLHQVPFSEAVKRAHGDKILVAAVGGINNAEDAQRVLEKGQADVVLMGRYFQKNPSAVGLFAEQLGVEIFRSYQIEWPTVGRGQSLLKRAAALT